MLHVKSVGHSVTQAIRLLTTRVSLAICNSFTSVIKEVCALTINQSSLNLYLSIPRGSQCKGLHTSTKPTT
jgi:hypothetical protein